MHITIKANLVHVIRLRCCYTAALVALHLLAYLCPTSQAPSPTGLRSWAAVAQQGQRPLLPWRLLSQNACCLRQQCLAPRGQALLLLLLPVVSQTLAVDLSGQVDCL